MLTERAGGLGGLHLGTCGGERGVRFSKTNADVEVAHPAPLHIILGANRVVEHLEVDEGTLLVGEDAERFDGAVRRE